MRIALFDIDGTLLDAHGAGRRAMAQAFQEEIGKHFDDSLRLDGKTDPEIVREAFERVGYPAGRAAKAVQAVCERYLPLLRQELASPSCSVTSLPGVASLLDGLREEPNVLPGLLTGNVAGGARLKLEAAGIPFDRFRVGAFGSDSKSRLGLPGVARERAETLLQGAVSSSDLVVIGDTPADVLCGKKSGADTIAVTTGRYAAASLRAAGAGRVFPTFQDTRAVIDAILG